MGTSIFIARIFSLCYLVVAIGLMFNRKAFKQAMEDFCKNAALVLYGGLFALVIGAAIILNHNVWAANWTVMITIIGWAAFIKGAWIIIFPHSVAKFMQIYKKNEKLLLAHSIIALILGLALAYFSFFA